MVFKIVLWVMIFLVVMLLVASVPIFVHQLEESVHNSLFSIFYGSLAIIVVKEILTFLAPRPAGK